MKVVLKGSFLDTDVNAAFASKGEWHDNSTSTEPTLILVIQWSTEPFPLPILTSRGFFVTGIWGKTLNHNLPFLFRTLLIVIIAECNCALFNNEDCLETKA